MAATTACRVDDRRLEGVDAAVGDGSNDAQASCRSPSDPDCSVMADASPETTDDARVSLPDADASVDGNAGGQPNDAHDGSASETRDAGNTDVRDGGESDASDGAEACAPHACGGCATLAAKPGAACGTCGMYVCNGVGETVSCQDPAIGTVKAVAAGQGHTCVLTTNGGVRCWGFNGNGQLGDGTTTDRATPPATDILSGVAAISASGANTCALMSSGSVKCWGFGFHGELGNGSGADRSTPTDVLTSAGVLTGVRTVVSGRNHTCALMLDGGVRCWGFNDQGQLGDGTNTWRYVAPTSNLLTGAQGIAAGFYHTCAITASGAQCWGSNSGGQIGDGTTTNRLTPTTVMMSTGALIGVRAMAAGATHTCALMATGGIRCWGVNDVGQLGDGTATNRSTAPDADIPTGFDDIIAAGFHNCGLTSVGGARCWGWNAQGQLGDGTMSSRFLAISSDVLGGVQAVGAGDGHTCAATMSGVQCWGINNYGQLGDGTGMARSTPGPAEPICP